MGTVRPIQVMFGFAELGKNSEFTEPFGSVFKMVNENVDSLSSVAVSPQSDLAVNIIGDTLPCAIGSRQLEPWCGLFAMNPGTLKRSARTSGRCRFFKS